MQLINQLVSAGVYIKSELRSFEFATARASGISGGHAKKQTSEVKIGDAWFVNGVLFDAAWMLLYSIRFIVVLFCFVLNFIFSFFLNCKVFGWFFLCKFGVDCLVDQVLERVWYSTWPPGHQVHPHNLPENSFLLWKSWLKVVHIGLATFLALIIC